MKIAEPKWSPYSKELNQAALDNPQVGDYWSERMCPYFLVVDVQGADYTILCAFPNDKVAQMARVIGTDTWEFDYSKHSVVSKDWIKKTVCYTSIPGFVADVARNEKMRAIAEEWAGVNPDYAPVHIPFYKQHAEWWLGA